MYYTVYKTTNLVNGKIYIGVHKTANLDDGYIGSGKRLQLAITKYGIDNFSKDILAIFDNANDMFDMESVLVNESFVQDPNTYNLKEGGQGGWDHVDQSTSFKGRTHSNETKDKISKQKVGKKLSSEHKKKLSAKQIGRVQSPETRKKISDARKLLSIKHSNDTKEKIRQSSLGIKQDISKCPHCNKEGGVRAMKRWHFDNCKMLEHPTGIEPASLP